MRAVTFAAALLLSPLLSAATALACTMGAFPFPHVESQGFFIGTPSSDTLLAGPGAMVYGAGAGHFGTGGPRAIFGQVVKVDRIGGPASAGLRASAGEVVVVPWDYDAACRPLPWGRSALQATPGARGLYVATLRAREHWADNRPTFDLRNPGDLPYTGRDPIWEMTGEPVASLLSPDEVFDFFRAAPSSAEIAREGERAIEPLRGWLKDHPDLAVRPPVSFLLGSLVSALDRVALEKVDHPVLGTWRFTLSIPGDSSSTFYLRSEPTADGHWRPSRRRTARAPGDLEPPPIEGYGFLAVLSRRLEALPNTLVDRRNSVYLYALASTDTTSLGEASWRGSLRGLLEAFRGDARVRSAIAEAGERMMKRFEQGLSEETPARFVRGADGVLRVRETIPLDGSEPLILEGEQLSRTVVQTPR